MAIVFVLFALLSSAFGADQISTGIIGQLLALEPPTTFAMTVEITDEHFPTAAMPLLDGATIETYTERVSSDFVLADFRSRGRRAATVAELLLYGLKNPEEQEKHWIIALGQVWKSSRGDLIVKIGVDGPHRFVERDWLSYPWLREEKAYEWNSAYAFLSFPMTSAELAERDAVDVAKGVENIAK